MYLLPPLLAIHLLFPLHAGISQVGRGVQAGEAEGETGGTEHRILPGSLPGVFGSPGIQEAEGRSWGGVKWGSGQAAWYPEAQAPKRSHPYKAKDVIQVCLLANRHHFQCEAESTGPGS